MLCTTWGTLKIEPLGFLGALAKLRKATISYVMFVCASARDTSAFTGWIFIKADIQVFFEKLSDKSSFIKIGQEYWITYMKTDKQF
jgi:hypothetical protein